MSTALISLYLTASEKQNAAQMVDRTNAAPIHEGVRGDSAAALRSPSTAAVAQSPARSNWSLSDVSPASPASPGYDTLRPHGVHAGDAWLHSEAPSSGRALMCETPLPGGVTTRARAARAAEVATARELSDARADPRARAAAPLQRQGPPTLHGDGGAAPRPGDLSLRAMGEGTGRPGGDAQSASRRKQSLDARDRAGAAGVERDVHAVPAAAPGSPAFLAASPQSRGAYKHE